ncbi:MAG TPA: hypothetical protein VF688_13170, partial [Allosphingosinicella sp.]
MIEGWVTAIETMPEGSAATAALRRRRRDARAAAIFQSSAMPFGRFCGEEGLVRSWRRLEESASLPMQSHAFASALAGTLLADAHIDIFFVRERDEVTALLALCREPKRLARWTLVGAHQVCEPDDALCRTPQGARFLAKAIVGDGRALDFDRVPAGSKL